MSLPEPTEIYFGHYGYTEAQMREMYQQGLEDAAKVCDSIHPGLSTAFVAEAIRALKEKVNES